MVDVGLGLGLGLVIFEILKDTTDEQSLLATWASS